MRWRRTMLVVVGALTAVGAVACRSPEQKQADMPERATSTAAVRATTEHAATARPVDETRPVVRAGTSGRSAPGTSSPASASEGWVTCETTLVAVNPQFHWFDDDGGRHDDGVAVLATFRITAPEAYAGRKAAILFKYARRLTPPTAAQVGQRFTLQVPSDFLAGKAWILDNLTARALAPSTPVRD